jgi:DNA-binding CsgD family transcriptional regulator
VRTELEAQAYVHDLEEHLRLNLFGGVAADPEAAVLLVRGALAGGDQVRATALARETTSLAAGSPEDPDLAAAADHVGGLVERDPGALERAAGRYRAPLARAWATEDAGIAWAERGDQAAAVTRLRQAHGLYEELGAADGAARVRARLRAGGTRLRHWSPADRPALGWASLTDTEGRIVELVAQGLSNRQVAARMFLSSHTVAFHLRHVFWKLDVSSRVQLARLAAERPGSR